MLALIVSNQLFGGDGMIPWVNRIAFLFGEGDRLACWGLEVSQAQINARETRRCRDSITQKGADY